MNADLPGDIGPGEPGLDQLVGLLTASATPDELSGESAALAMFRASQQPATAVPGRRAPGRHARRVRVLAAAVPVALACGFAAAGYAAVLPAPVQHVAYRVLGFAGVPDVHRGRPASAGSHPGGPAPARSASQTPGRPQRSAAASASPAVPQPRVSSSAGAAAAAAARLSVTVARGRIAAGTGEVFVGWLTDHGRAVQGAKLSLSERAAGHPAWRPAGDATTGPDGRAVLTVPDLTTDASFRLTGPDGARSQPVLIIVVPPVSASLTSGPRGQPDVLTASSPLAVPGDAVVLQVRSRQRWLSVQVQRLDSGGQAAFRLGFDARTRLYQVVLPATAAHGGSVSNPVPVPSAAG